MTNCFGLGVTTLFCVSLSQGLSAQVRPSAPLSLPFSRLTASAPDHQLLIRLQNRSGLDARNYPAALTQISEHIRPIPQIGFLEVTLKAGVNRASALARLKTLSGIADVLKPHLLQHCSTPNDPFFSSQYGPIRMRMPAAWSLWTPLTEPNKPIIIASVDTGVMGTHEDLTAKMLRDPLGQIYGFDSTVLNTNGTYGQVGDASDNYGHGTHTAGTMAATINNGIGVAGIAGWTGAAGIVDTTSVKIMPVKVLSASGFGTDQNVADGVIWATDHGARVINMSLGDDFTRDDNNNPIPDPAAAAAASPLHDATAYAISHGVTVVCAAGNYGSTNYFYPAAYPNTISVAATMNEDGDPLPYWSNRGSWVNVSAPGADVYSTLNNGGYTYESGTSMASPHVAGLVALLLAQNPTLTNTRVRQIVLSTVRPYGAGSLISSTGGPVDALNALNTALTTLAVVTGTVSVQNSLTADQSVTVTFTPTDGSAPFTRTTLLTQLSSGSATSSAVGTFSFSRVLPKAYRIRIKTAQTLAKAVMLNTAGGGPFSLSVSLRTGDVNNNNLVDVDDLTLLLGAYNTALGSSQYLAAADLNHNGRIDVDDLTSLLNNYNTQGDR